MAAAVVFGGSLARAIVSDFAIVGVMHQPLAVHADQGALNALPDAEAFTEAFELGDELFATAFNALDGGGANVGRGQRFSRIPRSDLKEAGEWFTHTPIRVTGPNAAGCFECHETPFEDGSGAASANVHRDPFRTGRIEQFVQRNTPHVFAPGAIQRLAEEMTDELTAHQQRLVTDTCTRGGTQTVALAAKGIAFGSLTATHIQGSDPCQVTFDTGGVRGVDFLPSVENPIAGPLLIVRPFQWKGSVAFLRDFNRGASHNELGMQSIEIVGDGVDGDFDGVANEFTIGDQTALSIYLAAQPRPTSLVELQSLGLLEPPLTGVQVVTILRGFAVFNQIGCASCHVPALPLDRPIFSEPSQNAAYRDGAAFPAGQDTVAVGVDPRNPVAFDLTKDQPDNVIRTARGGVRARLGSFTRRDLQGRTIVELFGDLKRHAMGPNLAEAVNEIAGDDVTPHSAGSEEPPHARHVPDREPVGCGIDRPVHARRPCNDADRGDPRTRRLQRRCGQRGTRVAGGLYDTITAGSARAPCVSREPRALQTGRGRGSWRRRRLLGARRPPRATREDRTQGVSHQGAAGLSRVQIASGSSSENGLR